MKIVDVEILPLKDKYYGTNIRVRFIDPHTDRVEVLYLEAYGGNYQPSIREIDRGWNPDDGMNHVESDATYHIALMIKEALEK